jgi:hypothetical protein
MLNKPVDAQRLVALFDELVLAENVAGPRARLKPEAGWGLFRVQPADVAVTSKRPSGCTVVKEPRWSVSIDEVWSALRTRITCTR